MIRSKLMGSVAVVVLVLASCKSEVPEKQTEPAVAETAPEATKTEVAEEPKPSEAPSTSELDRLLKWIPDEPTAVAYDRMGQRLDPATLGVVFGIPPKAAHLLDERDTLDEALPLVFEGETDASTWLAPTSFAFTISLTRSPYFVRILSKPAAEVGKILAAAGFTMNTIDGVELWLPSGSFMWRIALLEGDVAVFIPVDVPGAGLEALIPHADGDETGETGGETGGEAGGENGEPQPAGATAKQVVETELRRALTEDPMIELVLIASGPLAHLDVALPIAQVQFALRRTTVTGDPAYEGRVVLAPTGDADECANALRARKYPEENQQVQTLIAGVEFVVIEQTVMGRLEIPPDQVKHFLSR